jgi:hypothetical protein
MNFIKRALQRVKMRKIVRMRPAIRSIKKKVMLSGTIADLSKMDSAIQQHGAQSIEAKKAKVNLALIFLNKQFKHAHLLNKIDEITLALENVENRKAQLKGFKRPTTNDTHYHKLLTELKNHFQTQLQYERFVTAYRLIDSDVKTVMNRERSKIKK